MNAWGQKWMTAGLMLAAAGVAAFLFYHNMNQGTKKRMKKYATRMLGEVEEAAMEMCPWCR